MEYEELLNLLENFGEMVSETFGSKCEVVISDLDDPDHAIMYIYNGQVTGRNVGDPLDAQARSRVAASADGLYCNYHKFKNNKDIKASTFSFSACGHNLAICINYDITSFQVLQSLVAQFTDFYPAAGKPDSDSDISMDRAIDAAIAATGKTAFFLNKEDRLQVLLTLQKQGMLNMQKSVPTIAKAMGVSRYSIYNYLNELNIK